MGLEGMLTRNNHKSAVVLTKPGDCDHRLHMRRYPSRRTAGNLINICHRFIQARVGLHLRSDHGQQECLGLRLLQVHHAVD